MAFKFFQSFGFTGMPSLSKFRSDYNIYSNYVATGAFLNDTSLTLDEARINSEIAYCVNNGYDSLSWDLKGANLITYKNKTEEEIDLVLESLKSIYDLSKRRLNELGFPDLLVGFVDIPGGSEDLYKIILDYNTSPNNTLISQNYKRWTDWLKRLNKRKSQDSFIDSPFNLSFDFILCEVPSYNGDSNKEVSNWNIFARNKLQEYKNIISLDKYLFSYSSVYFDRSSYYSGVQLSTNTLNEVINTSKLYADGLLLTGGDGASYKFINFRYRPTGISEASNLLAWNNVTDGAFSISIASAKFKITGINTSSASSMNNVASILQTAINTRIGSGVTFDSVYPLPLGNITVTWNSGLGSFLFTMTSNGSLTTQPPNTDRSVDLNISSKNDWGASLSGTDLSLPQFIGNKTTNTSASPFDKNYVHQTTRSSTEWDVYVDNQAWFSSLTSQSFIETLSNPVIASINAVSLTSGEFPYTVHVDASSCTFNGVNPEDCLFEWDFGDNNPPTSDIKKRNIFDDHRLDFDKDSDGKNERKSSLSNKQVGYNAAYTYWHNNLGQPFVITLKVFYKGLQSNTATTNINVAARTGWVTLQVGSSYSYTTIDSAISWIDANRPSGKVLIELKDSVHTIGNSGSPITISKPDIIIYGTVNSSDNTRTQIYADSNLSRVSPVSLFTISPTAYNVHFYDLQFGSTSVSGQNDDTTSNLIGCSIKTPSVIPTVKNVTFSGCYFRNLYQAINTEVSVVGVYINKCHTSRTNIKSFDFLGSNISISSSFNAALNGFSTGSQTLGVSTDQDSCIHIGSTGTTSKVSLNYCDIRRNVNFSSSSISSGSVYIKNASNVTVHGCILNSGSNYIENSSNIRIDSNLIYSGGTKSAIICYSPSNNISIVNNYIEPQTYSNGQRFNTSGAFEIAGSSGSLSNVKIINNTIVAKFNMSRSFAFWNFVKSGVTLSNFEFVNNLAIEDSAFCISRWINFSGSNSQFSKFSNNIWPLRLDLTEFCFINGVVKNYQQWKDYGLDLDSDKMEILTSDILNIYKRKTFHNNCQKVLTRSINHKSVSKDYNGHLRLLTNHCVGASKPIFYYDEVVGPFSNSTSITTRSRTVDGAWTPPSGCENGFTSVTDNYVNTVDSNLTSVSKPVIKNTGSLNFLQFSSSFNSSQSRAFRIKFDPNTNSLYKNASFGIVSDSGINKFYAAYSLSDSTIANLYTVNESILLTLSSYSTVQDLVNEINNQIVLKGLTGTTVEILGSAHVLTSNLKIKGTSLNDVINKNNQSIFTSSNFGGYSKWAVQDFNDGTTIGNYINTKVSVTNTDDGYDLKITYTNDGPDNQTFGDLRQRIGSINIGGILIGDRFVVIRNTEGIVFNEVNTNFTNYFSPQLKYPFDRFSPTTNVIGETYAVGISVIDDFTNSYRKTEEFVSQTGGYLNAQTNWITNTQGDTNVVNGDCLIQGESLDVTVSVRITRNVRDWVKTLKPYKDYLSQKYGSVKYMKDPRPIRTLLPSITGNNQPLFYHDYQSAGYQNPAKYGWAWWSNKIKKLNTQNGYERFLMWSFSGQYCSNTFDYSNLILSPFFNTKQQFPHTSGVDNCSAQPDLINTSLLNNTLYMIRDAIQEVPVFGFYQGYGTQNHIKWDPEINNILDSGDMTSPYIVDKMDSEVHLMASYMKSNYIGLDAYSSGSPSLKDNTRYLDFLMERYPGMKILCELSPEDLTLLKSSGFLFSSTGVVSPHYLADYLIPGNEQVAVVFYNTIWSEFDQNYLAVNNTSTKWFIKSILAAYARYGFVVSTYEQFEQYDQFEQSDDDFSSSGEGSIYQSVDRRFVYDTMPESVSNLNQPSSIKHKLADSISSKDYSDKNKQSITLFWDKNTESDFSHYTIHKAKVINGVVQGYQLKHYLKYPTFTDYQVFSDATYSYKITAYDIYGNSAQSIYQVSYKSDDPSLNPPSNVSSSVSVDNNNITISWSDPSSGSNIQTKQVPKIIIDGSFSSTELSSKLFDLPYVHLLVKDAVQISDVDNRTMSQRATDSFNKIKQIKDRWNSVRPGQTFRWAFCPENFGLYDWGTSNTGLFKHSSDRLSNGNRSLWTVNGRLEAKNRMNSYFLFLNSLLRAEGIQDPVLIDANYQAGISIAGDDPAQRNTWHSLLSADSRFSSTTFDGNTTYANYVSSLKDLEGYSISSGSLYPDKNDFSYSNNKKIHVYSSISSMVVDYALSDSLYSPAKQYWPNVKTSNTNIFGANRSYLNNVSRFRDSPVDFGANLKADLHSVYHDKWYPQDSYSYPSNVYLDTYQESLNRYNINTSSIKDNNDIIKSIRISQINNSLNGCESSNFNKEIIQWLTYNNIPTIYSNVYEPSSSKFPSDFSAVFMEDRDQIINIFKVMINKNVSFVGWKCNTSFNKTTNDYIDTYDKIYQALNNLGNIGYII